MKSNCENCANYVYDDEDDCYYCEARLDEDDMYRFVSGQTGNCPYFNFYDEYSIVRKQNQRFRKNEVPPKDAIVYLQEYENPEISAERYEKTGVLPETKNINAWHLEKGTLELLDDPNTEADQKDKNLRAMYYKQATFRIKIDIDNAQGFLDFTMGPLFGRGFVVDIMGDTNSICIGPAKLRWMSQ